MNKKLGKYQPAVIEKKWREVWDKEKLYEFKENPKKKKYYNLVEFPYPSGDLHLGHWFAFVPPDVHARYKKMSGYNVFFSNGFDAFGLPAENAAIKRNIHPQDWTMANIETMTRQFETMGTTIDWSHKVISCLPEYYRWNQWIFIEMFKKGIAYRGKTLSNWCPVDQTVLANEHVENGKCWRCGTEVVQKEVAQWFLRITDYADKLLWDNTDKEISNGVDWPKSVRVGQNNWIGRSEGVILDFDGIKVFTTRPETTDGATFLVLAPEHPLIKKLTTKEQKNEVENYAKVVENKSELERKENKEKTGVFTGSFVKNPITDKEIPVWIADYVLMGYGTGAIMAVPYADERDKAFAKKFNLSIIETNFKSVPTAEKKVNYHLHDWSISRQRYWGTPVPMIDCKKCGIVPVPEKDLPVKIPYDVDYAPKGKPPLASNEEWMKVSCPKCGGEAQRDPETLDTFFDSSWYFFRYIDPKYDKGPFDKLRVAKLLPVDIYFGGAEHTLGHTLYARFFTKFFKDLGLIVLDEFANKRVQHGVVLGPDGNRMSKSKGNVVNPDDIVKEYGTDAVRLYLCFMMPYEATAPWDPGAIAGIYRFLRRVWDLSEKIEMENDKCKMENDDLFIMHRTIQKVGEDLGSIKFNTAVAAMMQWLNHLGRRESISEEEFKIFLLLLAPFAPHFTEELWQYVELGIKNQELRKGEENHNSKFIIHNSIHNQDWPEFDEKYLTQDEVTIVVQVNGKVRENIRIMNHELGIKEEIEKRAKESGKVKVHLEGKTIMKVIYIPGKILNFVTD